MEVKRNDDLMGAIIDWELDIKMILQKIERSLRDPFAQKGYFVACNPQKSQKSVDIFPKGGTHKDHVISIWPHNRKRNLTLHVKKDLLIIMRRTVNLPPDKDVKEGRYPEWRRFDDVTIEKATEMFKAILTN